MELSDKKQVIIFDLEATCWENRPEMVSQMEIIEIGAVKADLNSMKIVDEFDEFVRPIRNPQLSAFCKQLTTIAQEEVDSARVFQEVIADFVAWIGETKEVALISWGNYDRKQLIQDCRFHQIVYPFGDNHINLKQVFADLNRGKKFGVKRALRVTGQKLEGIHHRGIDDARNIFKIFKILHTQKMG